MTQPDPEGQIIHGEQGWQFGRIVDPVRAAALHEAILAWPDMAYSTATEKTKGDPIAEVLQLAERFERWLAGTDKVTP